MDGCPVYAWKLILFDIYCWLDSEREDGEETQDTNFVPLFCLRYYGLDLTSPFGETHDITSLIIDS